MPESCWVYTPTSHFAAINLPDSNFCTAHEVFLGVDYRNSKPKLFFGGELVFKSSQFLWPELF